MSTDRRHTYTGIPVPKWWPTPFAEGYTDNLHLLWFQQLYRRPWWKKLLYRAGWRHGRKLRQVRDAD